LIDGFSTSRLLDIIDRLKVYELQTGAHPDRLGRWLIDRVAAHARGSNRSARNQKVAM
jgi:hypothetical protein